MVETVLAYVYTIAMCSLTSKSVSKSEIVYVEILKSLSDRATNGEAGEYNVVAPDE